MKSLQMIKNFVRSQKLEKALEDGDQNIIDSLEQDGSKVYYVINASMWVSLDEMITTTSYLIYDEQDYQTKANAKKFIEDFNNGNVKSYTINHTSQTKEYRTIGFRKHQGLFGNFLSSNYDTY